MTLVKIYWILMFYRHTYYLYSAQNSSRYSSQIQPDWLYVSYSCSLPYLRNTFKNNRILLLILKDLFMFEKWQPFWFCGRSRVSVNTRIFSNIGKILRHHWLAILPGLSLCYHNQFQTSRLTILQQFASPYLRLQPVRIDLVCVGENMSHILIVNVCLWPYLGSYRLRYYHTLSINWGER